MTPPSNKKCCAPARPASRLPPVGRERTDCQQPALASEMETAAIPGGHPILGTATPRIPHDGEELRRSGPLKPFQIGTTTVTNAEFARFVDATSYVTEAEEFGWSFVFWSDVPPHVTDAPMVPGMEWWRRVDGANWRDINGPGSRESAWKPDHPVVQVSWRDANAFADWSGGRLPSEAQWEHAARGGLGDVPYPWGKTEPTDEDNLFCNIWQGTFPKHNTEADGFLTTSPARSFAENGYGLFNMVGNVWEWTRDPHTNPSLTKAARERAKAMRGYRILKGGSFLCHRSYCWRYRIAARTATSPDSATPHTGFRVVFEC